MLQHNHLFGILDCKPIFLKTSFLKVAFLLIDLLEKNYLSVCSLKRGKTPRIAERYGKRQKRRSKRFLTGRVIWTPVRVSRSWTILRPASRS